MSMFAVRCFTGVFCGICVGTGIGELSRHSPSAAAILAIGWFGYLVVDVATRLLEASRG